jgi:hypothetical protein
VAGFATIAAPLHALTSSDKKFEWNNNCQTAFEKLKEALCGSPVLAFPIPNAQFILDTDASNHGIGAVLSQLILVEVDDQGVEKFEERVLSYASRTLNVHERRYCTTRKELLAVVWFLRHFRPYLYGRNFFVRTDHASPQWLCSFWEPEGQVARWLQILGEYTFKVIHREGKKRGNADGLSRQGPYKQCGYNEESLGDNHEQILCTERVREVDTISRHITTVNAITLTSEWTPNQLTVWQEVDRELAPVISPTKWTTAGG